jgi:hypothetical protein
MSKPHLVVVPGAWHLPYHMSAVTSRLTELGYTIHARQMPAVGNPNPPKDLFDDIAAMDAMVQEAIGPDGNDVVVICHSWGGIVTGSGLKGLSKKEREEQGKKGGVVRTGYIAAFIFDEGFSLLDGTGGTEPGWSTVEVRYARHLSSHFDVCKENAWY